MAETQEIILEINVKDSLTKTAELKASINELIAQRQDLAEAAKKGDEDSAKALEAVNVAVRLQQQEYRTQTKILDGYVAQKKKETDTLVYANNSIQQNRDLLKQMTAQYVTLQKPLPETTQKLKALSDALKEQESAIGDNRRSVGGYKDAFVGAFQSITSSVPALKGFQTAQLGVNAAMNANPIGAVVLLLQGLFEIFSKNKAVADQVTFAIDGLSKGFGVIIDTVVDTVTNFDKLTEALRHPIDFLYNMGKASASAAKEGYNASKAIDELTETIGRNGVAIAKNNAAIEEQKTVLAKVSSGVEARKKAAQEIIKLEDANAKMLVANAQTELDAERMKLKGLTLSGEQKRKLYELESKVIEENSKAITASRRAEVRLALLLGGEVVKATKENSDKVVKIKQEELKSLESIFAKEKELSDKAFDDETNRLLDAEVKQAQITANRVGSVNARIDAEIIARTRLLDNEKLNETERENIIRESENRITAIRQAEADRQLDIQKQKEDDIKTVIVAGVEFVKDMISTIGSYLNQQTQNEIEGYRSAANEQKELLKEQYDNKRITKKRFDRESEAIDKKMRAEEAALSLKAWERNKAIQITMAVINTAQAVMAQLSNPTPYVGIVLAALAAATGAVQIGIIASQQPPKFAKGGKVIDIGGNYHEHGGTPIHVNGEYVAEAEKDEGLFIMKKEAYQAGKLSNWNQLYGGNSWGVNTRFAALGGAIPTIEGDGGFVSRDISRGQDNAYMMQEAIRNGFALAPSPKLSIVEFETRQAERNRSVNVSEGR